MSPDQSAIDARTAVGMLLRHIGENIDRPGLRETPARFVKALEEMTSGYKIDTGKLLKQFEGEGYTGIVLETNVDFVSLCEHHLLPFVGVAHIAYIPDGPIVGASKLARLVDAYARRLQVQERMTRQIVDDLWHGLRPKAAACIVEAHHSCMSCRGVGKANARFVTSWMRGLFMEKAEARAELEFLISLAARR